MNNKQIIITTSWDDGQDKDMKLINLLDKYGIKSTFYVPFTFKGQPVKNIKNLDKYLSYGVEIGGHTVDHITLTNIPEKIAYNQIIKCKSRLENILGKKIVSFSYPNGKFNVNIKKLVKKAGFLLGRTTKAFYTYVKDPFIMPVSFHFFPHNKLTILKHCLKEGNAKGILDWVLKYNLETDLIRLSQLFLEKIMNEGGILHIWGHSWEIEKYSLWNSLEKTLKLISNKKRVKYLSNGQLIAYIK